MKTRCSQWLVAGAFAMLWAAPSATETVLRQDVLRVDTRLVEVEVVVRDQVGPVVGLSRDDFVVFDEGTRQEIAVFEVGPPSPPEGQDGQPRGDVSNRADPEGAGRVTVLLFDQLNTLPMIQAKAKDYALEFIRSLDGGDEVTLYLLDRDGLVVVQEQTSDPDLLLGAAERLGTRQSLEMSLTGRAGITGGFGAEPGDIGLDQRLYDVSRRSLMEVSGLETARMAAGYYLDRRAAFTAEALEAIAGHLAGRAGRKNLVWLSAMFPFSFEPYTYFDPVTEVRRPSQVQMGRAGEALVRSGVAVYPMDVRGLTPILYPPGTETMADIAGITGGQAVVNSNGIARGIREAVDDVRGTYVLGFYPMGGASDSEFHDLRVEVAMDGVEVRHRAGYYGFGSPAYSLDERRDALRRLVASPLGATGIGLAAETDSTPNPSGELETRIMIDLNDLDLDLQGETWLGEVDVAFVTIREGDTRSEAHYNTAEIQLGVDEFQDAVRQGFVLLRHVHDGTPARLRVVVRDWGNNATGSLWVPLGR